MDNYLEPLKIEQALRSENMKLKYRKENNPKDINILDYTIIAALEKQMHMAVKPCKKIPGICKCPICRIELCHDESLRFCPECGQALKV
jgi:hypothetical protein